MTIVAALALGLGCHMAWAGNAAKGKEKSATCAACHGEDGNSQAPTFPRLAGQKEDYLVHSLEGYKAGTRKNPTMNAMAEALSKEDMKDLAAYFASQKGLAVKY
jgi:cytochrome c553